MRSRIHGGQTVGSIQADQAKHEVLNRLVTLNSLYAFIDVEEVVPLASRLEFFWQTPLDDKGQERRSPTRYARLGPFIYLGSAYEKYIFLKPWK